MPSRVETVFPSYIYRGQLSHSQAAKLNRDLIREISALEELDIEGRRWSHTHYQNGYSSYSSMDQLHLTSPNFGELEKLLRPHIRRFIKALKWDLSRGKPSMTTCWANSMGQGTHHTLHTHPLSVISGVYYVNMPKGSSPFKIEDPRMGFFMAAPPRLASAPANEQNYLSVLSKPGDFILFESWMRHEVPPHRGSQPRISISFNYEI